MCLDRIGSETYLVTQLRLRTDSKFYKNSKQTEIDRQTERERRIKTEYVDKHEKDPDIFHLKHLSYRTFGKMLSALEHTKRIFVGIYCTENKVTK